jgi:hypothetical protein
MNNELSVVCYKMGIKYCLLFFNTLCLLMLKVEFCDLDDVLLQWAI